MDELDVRVHEIVRTVREAGPAMHQDVRRIVEQANSEIVLRLNDVIGIQQREIDRHRAKGR